MLTDDCEWILVFPLQYGFPSFCLVPFFPPWTKKEEKPEYTEKDANGQIRKYWLNECYKNIVGIVEELEEKIGKEKLLDMYMDDTCYEKEIAKFDEQYGENALVLAQTYCFAFG